MFGFLQLVNLLQPSNFCILFIEQKSSYEAPYILVKQLFEFIHLYFPFRSNGDTVDFVFSWIQNHAILDYSFSIMHLPFVDLYGVDDFNHHFPARYQWISGIIRSRLFSGFKQLTPVLI